MEAATTFEDLIVWQKAHTCVLKVYRLSSDFLREEVYGLTALIRRAAISIPANIAERFKRRGRLEKARFLNIAQGSAGEMPYYLQVARDLNYGQDETIQALLEEVNKLLESYRGSILRSVPVAFRPVFVLGPAVFRFVDGAF
jgi:four helix bundle protein